MCTAAATSWYKESAYAWFSSSWHGNRHLCPCRARTTVTARHGAGNSATFAAGGFLFCAAVAAQINMRGSGRLDGLAERSLPMSWLRLHLSCVWWEQYGGVSIWSRQAAFLQQLVLQARLVINTSRKGLEGVLLGPGDSL